MGIDVLLGLLGGLALFLYGMQMTSSGLEAAAGDKMKSVLERLTANRFMGVLVGAVITAVIQSSSATTVMVVGFVNAGMMTLNQAVWIIMGANIGTTITGILVSLDMGAVAPLFAFVGVVLMVFVKKQKVQHIGQILAGHHALQGDGIAAGLPGLMDGHRVFTFEGRRQKRLFHMLRHLGGAQPPHHRRHGQHQHYRHCRRQSRGSDHCFPFHALSLLFRRLLPCL